jgi:hypothetical protein
VNQNELQIIERLKGGMSNSNYVVKLNNNYYTFRIPGKNAFAFVDRQIEAKTLALIKSLHIDGNLLIDIDLNTGYKISHYVDGTPVVFLNPADYYEKATSVLKKLHHSQLTAENDYAPFERLSNYEALV